MDEKITEETIATFRELCEIASFPKGSLLVIGGSSSEVKGGQIGKDSSDEIGKTIVCTLLKEAKRMGLHLAFQCCEHLNRALVMERDVAERYGYTEVTVVPWLHAGGAFSTNAYYQFENPIVVEKIQAVGGLDIGLTMIGMHLKRVVVPIRLIHNHIGSALVVAARCRPPLIGGERARYVRES